jgi:hypothetical protein
LALAGLAATGQVLNYLTRPGTLTLDDLRHELAGLNATLDQHTHAEAEYKLALERLAEHSFDYAIAALQASIAAVPSLTAQEMLTYLYRQQGDLTNEAASWEKAVKTARERGDTLALVRLDNIGVPTPLQNIEGEHDLIGPSTRLSMGGENYETAVALQPGFYNCSEGPNDDSE